MNPIEAHIVKGRMEAEGIPAYVQHEHHIWAKWTISLALGLVKVQVRREDAEASQAVLENLHAGAYALSDEQDRDSLLCPKCDNTEQEPVTWSWKLALCMVVLFSIPLPYTIHRVQCLECKHSWTQKETRAYSLWISAAVMLLIATAFVVIERTLFFVCKVNYLGEICT